MLGCFLYLTSLLLRTGYVSDDSYNSVIRGTLLQQGQSLLSYIWEGIAKWFLKAGRLYPAIFYHYALFYWVQSLAAYKLLTLGVLLGGVVSLGAFVRRASGSLSLALFSALALPAFFQFRAWHDPFLAFAFSAPLFTWVAFLSFLSFWRYLESGRPARLGLSVLLFLVGALMYEVAYFLPVFYLLIAMSRGRRWGEAVRASAPFFALSAAFLLLFVLMRTRLNPSYDPGFYASSTVNLDPKAVFDAFLVQTSSVFPISYYLRTRPPLDRFFQGLDGAYGAALFLGSLWFLSDAAKGRAKARGAGFLAVFGFCLVLLISLLMAISGHQAELIHFGHGFGYIFVHAQYFGLVLMIAGGYAALCARLRSRALKLSAASLLAFGVAAAGMVNVAQNRSVALEANRFYLFPRSVLGSALEAGLLDGAPEGATILRRGRFPIDAKEFFTNYLKKRVQVAEPEDWFRERGRSGLEAVRRGEVFLLSYQYDRQRGEEGAVYFARLGEAVFHPGTEAPLELRPEGLRVFDFKSKRILAAPQGGQGLDFLEVMRISNDPPMDPSRLDWRRFAGKDVHAVWGDGFHGLDGTTASNVRWSGPRGEMAWVNLTRRAQCVRVTMSLSSGSAKPTELELTYSGRSEKLRIAPEPARYDRTWKLPPGLTRVRFESDGERFSAGDPRDIRFGVFDFKYALDPACGARTSSPATRGSYPR